MVVRVFSSLAESSLDLLVSASSAERMRSLRSLLAKRSAMNR